MLVLLCAALVRYDWNAVHSCDVHILKKMLKNENEYKEKNHKPDLMAGEDVLE